MRSRNSWTPNRQGVWGLPWPPAGYTGREQNGFVGFAQTRIASPNSNTLKNRHVFLILNYFFQNSSYVSGLSVGVSITIEVKRHFQHSILGTKLRTVEYTQQNVRLIQVLIYQPLNRLLPVMNK